MLIFHQNNNFTKCKTLVKTHHFQAKNKININITFINLFANKKEAETCLNPIENKINKKHKITIYQT